MTTSRVFTEAPLGPVVLRNRVVKSATNEGLSRGGLVTDRLVEFHRRHAAGGVAMTTLAYCSVSPEGRLYADQVVMRDEALEGLRTLADAVHGEGAAAAIQLVHAGYFANPNVSGSPAVAPSRIYNKYSLAHSEEMQEDDFARLTAAYGHAAEVAVAAGFDVVEVHAGHGYLLSQFLSPATNLRTDRWGGSPEGRARFPRRVLRTVRDAVARRAAVTAKINMRDGFEGGLELAGSIETMRWIASDGTVDALQLTGGFTSRNGMYLMRGDVPRKQMIALEKDRVRRLGMRLFARRLWPSVPYEDGFFLADAREVKAAVDLPLMVLGGMTSLELMEGAIGEGFAFVAMARALLREPDLILRMQRGETTRSLCVHGNECMAEMKRNGTRCVYVPEADWV